MRRITDPGALSTFIAESPDPVIVLLDLDHIEHNRVKDAVKSAVVMSGIDCRICWVDPKDAPVFTTSHEVSAVPTLLLFVNGKIVGKKLATVPSALADWIAVNSQSHAPAQPPNGSRGHASLGNYFRAPSVAQRRRALTLWWASKHLWTHHHGP